MFTLLTCMVFLIAIAVRAAMSMRSEEPMSTEWLMENGVSDGKQGWKDGPAWKEGLKYEQPETRE